eukprot:GHVL01036676.1.p1 GENE.GHVL01036676.1~~GHVL01036676.1.p1  ORF type:complete len:383 (+),score=70.67 GHVL01036676.1:116-1264(+)
MVKYGQYDVPKVDVEVDFKVGQPSVEMLPLASIREASLAKFAENDPSFLQYGDIPGYLEMRESLAKFLTSEYEKEVKTEDLFITNGVTGGLSLICSLYCKSGDVVFAEDPTYFLAKRIFADFKLKVVQIPMDEHGVIPDLLEEKIKEHGPPVFFYTIPVGHNPTGRTTSDERRKKLVFFAKKYNFLVVADEVYQLLTFPDAKKLSPMFYYDEEVAISMGSFSKILAPALRVGWFQAKKQLIQRIYDCGIFDSSGGINPVTSGIVHKCIDLGIQKKTLDYLRKELHTRALTMMESLKEFLPPGVTFEIPTGGYFILVKLPKDMLSTKLLEICIKNKVRFLPGTSFGQAFGEYLRLSFSFYCADDVKVGIQRLAHCINLLQNEK